MVRVCNTNQGYRLNSFPFHSYLTTTSNIVIAFLDQIIIFTVVVLFESRALN